MPDYRFHQLSRNQFNRNLHDRRDQGAPLNLSRYTHRGMGSGTNVVPEAGAPGAWSFGRGGVAFDLRSSNFDLPPFRRSAFPSLT